jgi:hypothetical protein
VYLVSTRPAVKDLAGGVAATAEVPPAVVSGGRALQWKTIPGR